MIARLESAGFVYSKHHGENGSDVAQSTYTTAPLSTALAWNLDDSEGATVGSGETQYSRTKKIIIQRITALENALKS